MVHSGAISFKTDRIYLECTVMGVEELIADLGSGLYIFRTIRGTSVVQV